MRKLTYCLGRQGGKFGVELLFYPSIVVACKGPCVLPAKLPMKVDRPSTSLPECVQAQSSSEEGDSTGTEW